MRIDREFVGHFAIAIVLLYAAFVLGIKTGEYNWPKKCVAAVERVIADQKEVRGGR